MTTDHFALAEAQMLEADERLQHGDHGRAADVACIASVHVDLAKLQLDRARALLGGEPEFAPPTDALPLQQLQKERAGLVAELDVLLDRKRRLEGSIVVNQRILGDARAQVDAHRRLQAAQALKASRR